MNAVNVALSVLVGNACSVLVTAAPALSVTTYTDTELDRLQAVAKAARKSLDDLDHFIDLVREGQAAALRLRLENE